MSAPGDTLNPLYMPETWPGGRAPAVWEVERSGDGWHYGSFLWCPDEPAFDNGIAGNLWWSSGWCRDFVAAMRNALREARELERKLHELKFGPRSYTPEQAEVIERAVAERRPLDTPPPPAEGDEGR